MFLFTTPLAFRLSLFPYTTLFRSPIAPKKELGFAANFLYMLNGKEAEPLEIDVIDKALIIHADHELNASTFTADRKSTRLNSSHVANSYAVFCVKKKNETKLLT